MSRCAVSALFSITPLARSCFAVAGSALARRSVQVTRSGHFLSAASFKHSILVSSALVVALLFVVALVVALLFGFVSTVLLFGFVSLPPVLFGFVCVSLPPVLFVGFVVFDGLVSLPPLLVLTATCVSLPPPLLCEPVPE